MKSVTFAFNMIKEITSTQNTYIKQLSQLKEKSRERKKSGLFLIEGKRELSLAIKGNYVIETILFYPELFSLEKVKLITKNSIKLIEISKEVFQKLAQRDTTEGVIAVAKYKDHSLDKIGAITKPPLILVTEAPEKPGNIGALLRTADAANVDAVIIANPKTDLYNPNIIRSSVGCVFTNQVATGTTKDIIQFLKSKNINIYCAALQASENYHTQDFTNPTAIVVGTEATGLSNEWLENAN